MMGKAGDRRVEAANRAQVEWRTFDLDSLIAEDHEARLICEVDPDFRTRG